MLGTGEVKLGILGYYVVYNEWDVEILCLMSAFYRGDEGGWGPRVISGSLTWDAGLFDVKGHVHGVGFWRSVRG